MLETKALIISQILKQNGPFRARHIWEPLGLSTQNVGNHLSRMVDRGLLIKTGITYEVAHKEHLIDELATAREPRYIEKPVDVGPFLFSRVHYDIDQVVRARVLDMPNAAERHMEANTMIDDAIEQLKLCKKWLNRKAYSVNKAAQGFDKERWEKVNGQN